VSPVRGDDIIERENECTDEPRRLPRSGADAIAAIATEDVGVTLTGMMITTMAFNIGFNIGT